MGICKTPGVACSIEAARFGKDQADPKSEKKYAKDEDGIFFHGLNLGGCCDAHKVLKHTRIPDGSATGGFGKDNDKRWLKYPSVGGYSAGRVPMVRYVDNNGDTLKYAFVLDPSYSDKKNWGNDVLKDWISADDDDRKLLVIYGSASTGKIIEEWIGALRKLKEDIRKSRIVVWKTKELHYEMVKHIPAMEDYTYVPKGGVADKDFGDVFANT
jgi:hypothetical protein